MTNRAKWLFPVKENPSLLLIELKDREGTFLSQGPQQKRELVLQKPKPSPLWIRGAAPVQPQVSLFLMGSPKPVDHSHKAEHFPWGMASPGQSLAHRQYFDDLRHSFYCSPCSQGKPNANIWSWARQKHTWLPRVVIFFIPEKEYPSKKG